MGVTEVEGVCEDGRSSGRPERSESSRSSLRQTAACALQQESPPFPHPHPQRSTVDAYALDSICAPALG